jgi:hypothetical protein
MYTTQRIATYVNDLADSQILHRYSSVDASVQAHKKSIKTYLDTFDAAYEGWNVLYIFYNGARLHDVSGENSGYVPRTRPLKPTSLQLSLFYAQIMPPPPIYVLSLNISRKVNMNEEETQ